MSPKKLYRPKPLELIEVEWSDALYDGDYDGKPEAFDGSLAKLCDCGYFVKRTKDAIVVASCHQPSNGTARWFVTIPLVNVTAIHPCGRRPSGEEEGK